MNMPGRFTRRAYSQRRPPFVIGLTGSIAMGKSVAACFLRFLGVPVFDADAAVHLLMGPHGVATAPIARRFPDVVGPKGVDRKALGAKVFADKQALRDLEKIVHPLVRRDRQRFFTATRAQRWRVVALDIPLLLESRGEAQCDVVMVVSAPGFLQRQRALKRPGMTPKKLAGILAQQMPDFEKQRRADIVIPSGLGKRESLRRIQRFLERLRVSVK